MTGWLDKVQSAPSQPSGGWLDKMSKPRPAAPVQGVVVDNTNAIDYTAPVEQVRNQIRALPEDQQRSAYAKWAKSYVGNERKGGGNYSDIIRNLARGTGIGSWLDEANAVTASIPNALGLGGPNYDEAKAYQDEVNRAVDRDSTKLGSLPVIGDVTVGGATKLAGGIASLPAMIKPFQGASALPTMGNLAASGLTYGALYGAGEGDSLAQRGQNAAVGAGLGLSLGPLGYLAGKAVGSAAGGIGRGARNAYEAATGRMQKDGLYAQLPNGTRRPMHPGAVRRVQRAFSDDDFANSTRAYNTRSAELGGEGMLLDFGPNLNAQANALGNQPGKNMQIVRGALEARDKGSQARINAVSDRAIGPRVNLPETVRNTVKQGSDNARPYYQAFYNTPIPDTPKLTGLMNRVKALMPNFEEKIGRTLQADGVDPKLLDNKAIIYDYTKRVLDDAWESAAGRNEKRIINNIRRELIEEVEGIEKRLHNGGSMWKAAREKSGAGLQFEEGTKRAKELFDDKVSMAQFQMNNGSQTPMELEGLRMGGREILRQRMDTARTAFANRDARQGSKGRQLLSGEETRRKIREVVPNPRDANEMVRTMDAEGVFAASSNDILGNSKTMPRQQAAREFPSAVPTVDAANEVGKKTLTGMGMEAAYRIANGILQGALDERRMMIAVDAANMLVMKGADRNKLARFFQEQARRQGISQQRREALAQVATAVARGARPTITSEANSEQ